MGTFAERLRRREIMNGLILKMAGSFLVEMAGLVGFDLVVIDTEHGVDDTYLLEHHLLAAAANDLPVLVRVPANDAACIQSALDLGAAGVIVPHVSTSADAARAVRYAHYPPVGTRGLALTTRAARHGTVSAADHLARSREATVVVVQIEDPEGASNAAAIGATDGVDGVWIGPNDLAVSMGIDPGDPALLDAVRQISTDVRAEAAVLDMCGSADDAARGHALGASIHLFTAHGLVLAASRRLLADLHDRQFGAQQSTLA